jgi:predicted amidohydrolase
MTHLRVAAAAFPLAPVADAAAWTASVRARVRFAADGGAELVVLPEYLTAPLLAIDRRWEAWTDFWLDTVRACARDFGVAVLGGSHLCQTPAGERNRSLLVDGHGEVLQDKLHPTPWERRWHLAPTETMHLAEVRGARVAVAICYDVEFPELIRAAARAGAEVLLVPSWTDDRAGFLRVRRCAQARCIENVLYAVHAPLVGGLPLADFEQACGSAVVLTPCDTGFAPEGVAAEGGWNLPEVVLADLDLPRLRRAREGGTVTPLKDARAADSYRVTAAERI